jgi:hypothetical protein
MTRDELLEELDERDRQMELARVRKRIYVSQVIKAEERRVAVEKWLVDQGVIDGAIGGAEVEIRPFMRVSEEEMEFAAWQWDVALRCVSETDPGL